MLEVQNSMLQTNIKQCGRLIVMCNQYFLFNYFNMILIFLSERLYILIKMVFHSCDCYCLRLECTLDGDAEKRNELVAVNNSF